MADELEKVAAGLARLEVTVAEGFHGIDYKFHGIDQKFRGIDQKFVSIYQKFVSIDRRFDTIDRQFGDVAKKFYEAEQRDAALSRKIDVATESLRGDIRTVLDAVSSLADELRRTTTSIREEHAADRDILRLAIEDHSRRLHRLER